MEALIEQQLKALINPYNELSANKRLTVDYVKSQKAKCIALLTDRMQYMNQSSADYKEYDFLARSLLNGWLVSDIISLKTLYQTVQKLPEADGKRRRGEALLDQYKFVKADTLTKRAALHQLSLNTLFSVNTTVSRTYLSNFGKRTVFPAEFPDDMDFKIVSKSEKPEDGVVFETFSSSAENPELYKRLVELARSQDNYVMQELTDQERQAERNAPANKSRLHRFVGGIREKASDSIRKSFGDSAYDEIWEMSRGSAEERRVTLHHSVGTKYQKQGHDVLQMEFAGSNGSEPLKNHKTYNDISKHLKTMSPEELNAAYGEAATKANSEAKLDLVRKKERTIELPDGVKAQKIRYNFAGVSPGVLWGLPNFGDYSVQSSRDNARFYAEQFLEPRFKQWLDDIKNGRTPKPVHIELSGHSRGAVTAGVAAVAIDKWVTKYLSQHPEMAGFKKYINYDLILRDPVPGLGTSAVIGDCDLRGIPNVNCTVLCSMGIQTPQFLFPMQHVRGSKKIILNMEDHQMEIAGTDNTQKEIAGNNNSGHMVGYFDSETGEMHRGSGLSELPDGVYVADEKYRLVRVTSYSQLLTLHDTVFKNSSPQSVRIRRIHKMVRDWFCENELDMSFPDERTHKAEANKAKKIRGSILNTNAGRLDPVKAEIRRLQKLEQKPNVTKEERIQQNYRLISACRSYLKKTAMPPTGESARKVGMVGDVLSYAMRENNLFAKELKLYRDDNPKNVLDEKIQNFRDRLEHKEGYLQRKCDLESKRLAQVNGVQQLVNDTKNYCQQKLRLIGEGYRWSKKTLPIKRMLEEGAALDDRKNLRELKDYYKRLNALPGKESFQDLNRLAAEKSTQLADLSKSIVEEETPIKVIADKHQADVRYLQQRNQELQQAMDEIPEDTFIAPAPQLKPNAPAPVISNF